MGNDVGVDNGLKGTKGHPPISHRPGDTELDKMKVPKEDSEDTALGESKPTENKPDQK